MEKHSFTSPFKLQVEYSVNSANSAKMWREDDVKNNLSGQVRDILPTRRGEKQLLDRYHALLTLIKKDGVRREELAPIAPGYVTVKIKLFLEPFIKGSGDSGLLEGWIYAGKEIANTTVKINLTDALPFIASLYASLALVVLTVFGIGRGANRGFGRFKLKTINNNYNNKYIDYNRLNKLIDMLKKLASLDSEESPHVAEDAKKLLIDILKYLIDQADSIITLSRTRQGQKGSSYVNDLTCIPRLSVAINGVPLGATGKLNELSVVKSTYINPKSGTSINDAIEMIAIAVTKQYWKTNPRGPGLAYNTWPLGLPRGSKVMCACGIKNIDEECEKSRRKKIVRNNESVECMIKYGYYVLDSDMASKVGNVNCLPSRVCHVQVPSGCPATIEEITDRVVKIGFGREEKASDVRRQSMFILFPLPKDNSLIAVIPLYAKDLDLVSSAADKCYKDLRLYHVGGHFVEVNKNKKKPCCNVHVVELGYALNRVGSNVTSTTAGPCSGWQGCGCGSDPAGIMEAKTNVDVRISTGGSSSGRCPTLSSSVVPSNLYYKVLEVAYNSIVKLLKGKC